MIRRQYVFSCQVCHGNGTGDREYFNGIITWQSWFKPAGEDLIKEARSIGVEKLRPYVDRAIRHDDIQVMALNRI